MEQQKKITPTAEKKLTRGPDRWIDYNTGHVVEQMTPPPPVMRPDGEYESLYIPYVNYRRVTEDGEFDNYVEGSKTWVKHANIVLASIAMSKTKDK